MLAFPSKNGAMLTSVEARLLDELQTARKLHEAVRYRLRHSVSNIPSGSQPPDGALGVHLAAASESEGRRAYVRAMRRYTDFILRGKLPDNLD